MSFAFEITTDDVITAVQRLGVNISEEKAQDLLLELDLNSVEQAALSELEMDDQIEAAYKEIAAQLHDEISFLT